MSKDVWVFETVPEASRWGQEVYDIEGDYLVEFNKVLCRRPRVPVKFPVEGAVLEIARGTGDYAVAITVLEGAPA